MNNGEKRVSTGNPCATAIVYSPIHREIFQELDLTLDVTALSISNNEEYLAFATNINKIVDEEPYIEIWQKLHASKCIPPNLQYVSFKQNSTNTTRRLIIKLLA
jgi:hypothetical protein